MQLNQQEVVLWNPRGFVRFSKVPTSQHYHNSLPFLQTHYKIIIILPFLFPFTKTNHSFPPQEVCWNKYSRLNWKLCPGKEKPPMIRVCLLKRRRREVKVDPKLGGQWNVKEKTHFHLFPLSPQQTYLNLQLFFLWP